MSRSERKPANDELVSGDLPLELRREFLLQAGLLNVGVLSGGTGLVLLAFTDRLVGGAILAGVGILLLILAGWRYRRESPSS